MGKDVKQVSIVMRSYNDVDVIRQTLQAVKCQTFKDFEVFGFDREKFCRWASDGNHQPVSWNDIYRS